MVRSSEPFTPKKMRKLLFLILICSISHASHAGGPWTQPQGKGYFKLSQWWIVFDQHYTDAGLVDPNITTGVFNTSLYAEYGFTNRLTGVLYFPFFSRNYMNNIVSSTTGETITEGEAINALGDTDVSLKYALNKPGSKVPVAASLLLGLPLGKTQGGEAGNLQTGDGEFNQMLRLDAGTGFTLSETKAAYVSAYAGFNNRTNGFSDEVRYGVEAGLGIQKKLWLIARLIGVESLKNGETAATATSTSIFANNTEYTSYSAEAAYYLTGKVGVSASFASAFRGEIIAASPSYSIGVFFDMQ